MSDIVRAALQQTSALAAPLIQISDDDNLYALGLSSFDLVYLITYLEDTHGIEFSREAMVRDNFSTIARIAATIAAAEKVTI